MNILFLRKLLEKLQHRYLSISLGGLKYILSVEDPEKNPNGIVDVFITEEGKHYPAVCGKDLVDVFVNTSLFKLACTDKQVFFLVVSKAMEAAIKEEITYSDQKVLIGAVAEYQPEDVEYLQAELEKYRPLNEKVI